jgi:hypothetical protein
MVTPVRPPGYRGTVFYIVSILPPGEWAVWEVWDVDEKVWKYGQVCDNTANPDQDKSETYNGGPFETYIPELSVYPPNTPPENRRAKVPAKPY